MRRALLLGTLCCVIGCGTKTGSSAQLPHVAMYSGAKIVTNGENDGIIGANLQTTDTLKQVIEFYERELGTKWDAGAIKGTKNGHRISVIVTVAGEKKTMIGITEPK